MDVAHEDPSFAQVRLKKFFRTNGFQLNFLILILFPNILHWKPAKKIKLDVVLGQNLGQIMSNFVKKLKKQVISLGFFSYYIWDYLLKQDSVVVKLPECKFIAIIARNIKF